MSPEHLDRSIGLESEVPGFDFFEDRVTDSEAFLQARALIVTRRNVSPKRLEAPGPSSAQRDALLELAGAAPDHGALTPWRFIEVGVDERHRLGEVFALALIDRDPGATLAQIEAAREKAQRAPLLLIAIARLGPAEPDTPALERMVSMGAAVQNILLGAHAMGFGAGLTSGQAMSSPRMARLCGLAPGEVAVCCINVGSVGPRGRHPGVRRASPAAAELLSALPPS